MGEPGVVDLILQKLSAPFYKPQLGTTALLAAPAKSKTDLVQKILSRGADMTLVSNSGRTALHTAAQSGEVDLLDVFSGVMDPNAADSFEETPLHVAAREGHTDFLSHLISADSSVHAVSVFGETPLIVAAKHGSARCVAKLMQHGADAAVQDMFGISAVGWARDQPEIIRALGPVSDATAKQGSTNGVVFQSIQEALNHLLSDHTDDDLARWVFLNRLARLLLFVSDNKDAGIAFQLVETRMRCAKPRKCSICNTALGARERMRDLYYRCRHCMIFIFCIDCSAQFRIRTSEVSRGCSFNHELVEMDRSGWADLKPGMVNERQTEREWLQSLHVKYGKLGVV